jgi:hypothetical protein
MLLASYRNGSPDGAPSLDLPKFLEFVPSDGSFRAVILDEVVLPSHGVAHRRAGRKFGFEERRWVFFVDSVIRDRRLDRAALRTRELQFPFCREPSVTRVPSVKRFDPLLLPPPMGKDPLDHDPLVGLRLVIRVGGKRAGDAKCRQDQEHAGGRRRTPESRRTVPTPDPGRKTRPPLFLRRFAGGGGPQQHCAAPGDGPHVGSAGRLPDCPFFGGRQRDLDV